MVIKMARLFHGSLPHDVLCLFENKKCTNFAADCWLYLLFNMIRDMDEVAGHTRKVERERDAIGGATDKRSEERRRGEG
jgi:hypothetical protein